MGAKKFPNLPKGAKKWPGLPKGAKKVGKGMNAPRPKNADGTIKSVKRKK